jgi:hypothetical protein
MWGNSHSAELLEMRREIEQLKKRMLGVERSYERAIEELRAEVRAGRMPEARPGEQEPS